MTKNWLQVKRRIRELYVVQGMSLTEVERHLRDNEGFNASTRAYRLKLQEWGYKKARDRSAHRSESVEQRPRTPLAAKIPEPACMPNHRNLPDCPEIPDEVVLDIINYIQDSDITRLQAIFHGPYGFTKRDWRIDFCPWRQDIIGRSLLSLAASRSTLEVVKLLMNEGAIANSKDTQTWNTPLMSAIVRNEVSIVDYLLSCGAYTGLLNSDGHHALHVAAMFAKDPRIVELLISRGAPLDAPAAEGKNDGATALDLALLRRAKDFDGEDHSIATGIIRTILDARAEVRGSEYLVVKPWLESPRRGNNPRDEDLELFLYFVHAGLDLQVEIDHLPDDLHTNPVTIEHALVFHTSGPFMRSFLAHSLQIAPQMGRKHLIHTLCAGCFYNYDTKLEENITEAIGTLLRRGVHPDIVDDTEYTPLNFLLDTVAWFNEDHPKRLASLRLLLEHGASPCYSDGISYPIRQVLEGPDYVAVEDSYVFDVICLLLQHFPSDLKGAPQWQQGFLKDYLPVTPRYFDYSAGGPFETIVQRLSGLQESSVDIFRRAAQAVSMRKFLEAQLSLESLERKYEDILEVLTLQRNQKLPGDSMPRNFVIDVLYLLSRTDDMKPAAVSPFSISRGFVGYNS